MAHTLQLRTLSRLEREQTVDRGWACDSSVAAIPIMYVLSRRKFDLAGRLEAIILRKNFRRTKSLTL